MKRHLAEASYLAVALTGFVLLVPAIAVYGWLDFTRWLRAERARRVER